MTPGQAVRNRQLQSGSGWPDLFLPEPRGIYYGLFLEVKDEGVKVFLKNGALASDKHLQNQAMVLSALAERGYAAQFVSGFDAAKKSIDEYLALPVT